LIWLSKAGTWLASMLLFSVSVLATISCVWGSIARCSLRQVKHRHFPNPREQTEKHQSQHPCERMPYPPASPRIGHARKNSSQRLQPYHERTSLQKSPLHRGLRQTNRQYYAPRPRKVRKEDFAVLLYFLADQFFRSWKKK
jgi:hypothetical protein